MAFIDADNIPIEWAQSTGWTRSFSTNPTHLDRMAKRPLITADKASQAPTLLELLEQDTDANPMGHVGYLMSQETPYCVIDVDAPPEIKAYMQRTKRAAASLEEEELLQLLEEKLIEPLPAALKSLISSTYTELSASGCGLHIVLKTDKELLYSQCSRAYKKAVDFDGQLSITNNYMVTTGKRYHKSPKTIQEVPFSLLDVIFGINDTSSTPKSLADLAETTASSEVLLSDTPPSLQEISQAVFLLPLDKSERIKTLYKQQFNEEYEHYHFWLQIGMALHNYGEITKQQAHCLELYIKWSATDPTDFTSDNDVAAKWSSFQERSEQSITYKTIFKLANAFEFQYPRPMYNKNGKKLINPDKCEYVNFKYLVDKYNLKLFLLDGGSIYATGDEDIMTKYFSLHGVKNWFNMYGPIDQGQLHAAMWRLCQDSHWKGLANAQNFVTAWLCEPKEELDTIKLWLDTPFEELPEELRYVSLPNGQKEYAANFDQNSNFDYLESCIEWREGENHALYKKMLKNTFMQLIKLHEPNDVELAFNDNGGMLAFIGPENSYKTTFFKKLLPSGLDFLRKDINQELDSEKNKRDFIRYLGSRAIVLVDEFEGFMNHKKSGAFFKSVISSNSTDFTEIYATKDTTSVKRKAIIVGTSNDTTQILSDNGSRRLWLCLVNTIDTSKLLKMNLHKFYSDLRAEFRQRVANGEQPWLLKLSETKEVTRQNLNIKARSSIDLDLEIAFPYNEPLDLTDEDVLEDLKNELAIRIKTPATAILEEPTRLLKTNHVQRMLKSLDLKVPPTAELERALQRYCSTYLGNPDKEIVLKTFSKVVPRVGKMDKPASRVISKGQICANKRTNGCWNYKFWILPLAEDYSASDDF